MDNTDILHLIIIMGVNLIASIISFCGADSDAASRVYGFVVAMNIIVLTLLYLAR